MVARIAFLTPLFFRENAEQADSLRFLVNLAKGVVETSHRRYHIELTCYGDAASTHAVSPGVRLRVLQVACTVPRSEDFLSWELAEVIGAADIVHIHQAFTRSSEMALLLAKQQHKPICVTDYGGISSSLGIQVDSLSLADSVLCPSHYLASRLPLPHTAEVIPGGVDTHWFVPSAEDMAREGVLASGRIAPGSGIEDLITVLPEALCLRVCGWADDVDYLAHLRELAGTKEVEFIAPLSLSDLRRQYQRALAYVQPAEGADTTKLATLLPEDVGLALFEAMACATPVMCGSAGPSAEFVEDGETGFLFDDPEHLAHQLRSLDNSLLLRMRQQARLAAERNYDQRLVGARLAAIYDGLLCPQREMAA